MAETALHGRFLQEQKIIKAYADYIQYRVGFSDTELTSIVNAVSKLEGVLGHERIIKFNGLVLGNKPEAQLVKDVFDFLHQHETQLKKERNWIVHSCKRNTLGDEDELPNISYWRELAEYMLPFVSINQWDDVEAYLRDRALETIRANRNEYGEVFDRRAEIEGIDYSIRLAKQLALNQTFNNITFLLYKHEELEIAGRLSDPTSEICAYRQAFILLMTAFDATVFDLVRVALRKNFFGLISVIKNQEKISMDDFVDCKTFDDFRDQIIERRLKTKYINDLLQDLNKQKIQLISTELGKSFEDLCEIIQRRNLHIHNRGKVDEHYLRKVNKGYSSINNFKVGDLAVIDEDYLEQANLLCADCIANITAWIEAI